MPLSGRGMLPGLDSGFSGFLDSVGASGPRGDACKARNAVLDERVPTSRAEEYRDDGAAAAHTDIADWNDQHNQYLTNRVARPWANALCPEHPRQPSEHAATFLPAVAVEVPLAEDAMLLRMVRFPRNVDVPVNYDAFATALRRAAGQVSPSQDDTETINDGLHLWDSGRSNTLAPRWVGLWMEARELFGELPSNDDPHWANRIRNRFGLSHVPLPAPVEVVLFRYRVWDLPFAAGSSVGRMLTVPSLLDGWLSSHFCPAPKHASPSSAIDDAGRAVNFDGFGDAPNREYVHAPIRHAAARAFRVGWIDAQPRVGLAAARDPFRSHTRRGAASGLRHWY